MVTNEVPCSSMQGSVKRRGRAWWKTGEVNGRGRIDLSSSRGEIARLLHRLGWAAIAAAAVVGQPGRVAVGIPAALVAADCLRQLGPLLVPAGRRYIEWAAIAAGGAATAAALSWAPTGPQPGFTGYFVVGSVTFSLYALGLAAWVAPVDRGHLARRLRASVAVWWAMAAVATSGSFPAHLPQHLSTTA